MNAQTTKVIELMRGDEGLRRGLGTKLQSAIHAGIDALPLSDATKKGVKECPKCQKRATAINKAEAKVKQFFGIGSDASPAKPNE